jgi:hypothetical protein
MIPASGEFTYATQGIRKSSGGAQLPENLNALSDTSPRIDSWSRYTPCHGPARWWCL